MTLYNSGLYDPARDYKECVTHHAMEIIRVAATEAVGGYMIHSMRIDELPQMCDRIAYQLSANIAAEALKPQPECYMGVHHEILIPDGWWQQFKHDCFPRWMLSRWPVMNKTLEVKTNIKIEVLAAYPMLNTVFPPGENHPVVKVFGHQDGGTCVVKVTNKEGEEWSAYRRAEQ